MPGTPEGSVKAVKTINRKYPGHWQRIGYRGGSAHVSKGFGRNPILASKAGSVGGKISRRPPNAMIPRAKACTFCADTGHLAYDCEIRKATIARRNYRRESQQLDREKMSRLAEKWASK